jgi:uncharacterized protein
MAKKRLVELGVDEVEALRLVDLEGLKMEEAAKKMDVSKPTLCRIVNSGRGKLADAVCNGKFININNNSMPKFDGTGPDGEGPLSGRGMGKCEGAKEASRGRRDGTGRGLGQNGGGRGRRSPRA